MSSQKTDKEPRPKRRFHKRTLVIVFCFVVIPWLLVAIPGEESGSFRANQGLTYSQYGYGWPCQHLFHIEAINYGGCWVPASPVDLDLTKKSAREIFPEQPLLKLNLGLDKNGGR